MYTRGQQLKYIDCINSGVFTNESTLAFKHIRPDTLYLQVYGFVTSCQV